MSGLSLNEMARLGRKNSKRAVSYMDIANLFTKHMHYVRGNDEARAFAELWSNRNDIAYMVGDKGFVGRLAVEAYFVRTRDEMRRKNLPLMVKAFPAYKIEESAEYLGYGDYEFHSLINPYIQVAGDNGTAKAVWWSPGLVGSTDAKDKQAHYYFSALIYTVDFINEESGWKIWHYREMDEFSFDIQPGTLNDMSYMSLMMKEPEEGEEPEHPGPPRFTKEQIAVKLVKGQKVPGRSGENLRILHGMCSADPPMDPIPGVKNNMMFFSGNGLPGVRRTLDDVIAPYETFSPQIGVVRHLADTLEDFLRFKDTE